MRDELGNLRVGKIADGHVHRHIDVDALVVPTAAVLERAREHLLGERLYEAAVLRERDERRRGHWSARRVVPARERLEAAREPGPYVDAGLERKAELARREQITQIGEQLHPLHAAGIVGGVVRDAAT